MNIRLPYWMCASVLLVLLAATALAEPMPKRVALVIGNADYPDARGPLHTPIGDARALAAEIRRSDFDVSVSENIERKDVQRTIDAFLAKINAGMTVLFYFAGIGIQVARETYLIPIDAQIWSEADVRRNGISIDSVLAEMDRKGARTKIVILDAARRNPFERRFRTVAAGLAALNASEGTIAFYAVRPGAVIHDRVGENSLFMGELIKELRVPNRTVGEVFNAARIGVSRASNKEQVPWVTSSLLDTFRFGQ
jgi:uncharacterized caspase-like protein